MIATPKISLLGGPATGSSYATSCCVSGCERRAWSPKVSYCLKCYGAVRNGEEPVPSGPLKKSEKDIRPARTRTRQPSTQSFDPDVFRKALARCGEDSAALACQLGVSTVTAYRWRKRFAESESAQAPPAEDRSATKRAG